MIYEVEDRFGNEIEVDTQNLSYNEIWLVLGLNDREMDAASRVIEAYDSAEIDVNRMIDDRYFSEDLEEDIFSPRAKQDADIALYKTLGELERASGNSWLVRKLIAEDLLELNKRWKILGGLSEHNQAPYRLNPGRLYALQESAEHEFYSRELVGDANVDEY